MTGRLEGVFVMVIQVHHPDQTREERKRQLDQMAKIACHIRQLDREYKATFGVEPPPEMSSSEKALRVLQREWPE